MDTVSAGGEEIGAAIRAISPNAAQAARGGDAGQDFAVVAEEAGHRGHLPADRSRRSPRCRP
ncbi:hypothetical protein KIH74_09255 [Kineosporia sp. J2-2]|uniref:Uncharacterized protein n=1 Tax=Kineosporia corallincola TaxID=2835133 RepID=A0ABS5TDH2_9ACTN|nr:hypothetical protein [Kineosporia corallincola]MBT0769105.1 hypothetical protein [Kineosporia corallincola]